MAFRCLSVSLISDCFDLTSWFSGVYLASNSILAWRNCGKVETRLWYCSSTSFGISFAGEPRERRRPCALLPSLRLLSLCRCWIDFDDCSAELANTSGLLRQFGFGAMQLFFRSHHFGAERTGAVSQGNNAGLLLQLFECILRLIQTGSHLVGLLCDKIESAGGAMDLKMFIEIAVNELAQNEGG